MKSYEDLGLKYEVNKIDKVFIKYLFENGFEIIKIKDFISKTIYELKKR